MQHLIAGAPRARRSSRRTHGERAAALVEFALVLPFLALMVFGTIDLGRAWQLQNRLSNAAREGAASVQFHPQAIASGCDGGQNVEDRARDEDPDLAGLPGYAVEVAEVTGGTTTPIAPACDIANGLEPGDTVRVTVRARLGLITPLVGVITGDPVPLARSVEVVVQG